jgi:geranylgeranyl diphosphate synthase type II
MTMSHFDLDAWLKTQKARVEALLGTRMKALAARTPPKLAEAMAYALLDGGKRLRPILCLGFADAAARTSNGGGPAADDAACALEMIPTYSLVHDDLPAMDDDDLRRGRPTTHKVYGEAMAILAGDALLTDAFAQLAGDSLVRGRLCAELGLAAGGAGMVGGQVLDIAEDRPAEEAYLLKLHRMKTGALIKAACRMGVLAGGGSADDLSAAETYGDAVGLAFQIADDILDVTSSAATMGKPTGADAAAGRHTFPAVVGLDRSRALAAEQVQRAQAALAKLEPVPGPLAAVARYTVERKN